VVTEDLERRAFQLFWSVYALLHFALTAPLWLPWPGIRHFAVTSWVAACWALARPSSPRRFVTLIAVWVAADLVALPFVPNHVLFTLFVNVTFLVALGETAWRERRSREPGRLVTRAFASFAPLARIELLILYGWATLHKLNRGYLDPATSCGWQFYREIADRLPLLPASAVWSHPVIAASLLVEAALPLLLFFRKARVAAIAGALAFHLLLSVHPRWLLESFGCAVLALLVLFLPPAPLAAAASWLERALPARRAAAIGKVALALAAALAVWVGVSRDQAVAGAIVHTARIAWFGWAALAAGLLAVGVGRARSSGAEPGRRARSLLWPPPRPSLAFLLPIAVLLNGALPYLGLKTETSFAMFSNLRTEAGEENHLLLPRLDWFDFQDDVVEIGAASHPELEHYAATGERLVWFELRRFLDRRSAEGIQVTYRRDGEWRQAGAVEPIPFLLDRTLVFRPLPPAGAPAVCRH
jgi:hypothetical protein